MKEVGENSEWSSLRLREAYLREKCAEELERYMHLSTCEGPYLKAQYMMRIGQYECCVFQLQMELSRWQRRFALRQKALNRGETPDLIAIERELDAEFEEYAAKIRERETELKEAAERSARDTASEEDATSIRMDYLKAVKKLHPDINPGLSEAAAELWRRIQQAYSNGEWSELKFLTGIVDEVLAGEKALESSPGTLAEYGKAIERLAAKCEALTLKRLELVGKEPFTFKNLLLDAGKVESMRKKLEEDAKKLQTAIDGYARAWNGGRRA